MATRQDANQARLNRAVQLHQQGHLDQAEKLYRDLLRQQPNRFDILYLLGIVVLAASKPGRALELLDRSIKANPRFPPAHCNRGLALAALRRHDEALASYDRAIALDPAFAAAWFNRGVVLQALRRHDAAIDSFGQATAHDPSDADAHNNLGHALNEAGRHAEALATLAKAIALRPGFAPAHCNRGNALTGLKRPAEALASYDRALALQPSLAEAWCNRGDALQELLRPDDAVASFERARALRPDFAEACFGQSLTLLLLGRYQEGFRLHEWRKRRADPAAARSLPYPLWLGDTDIAGKTLFIHPELFLGDMINFCRYAKLAEQRGARVVLAAQAPLRRLLTSLSPAITVIADADPPGRVDCHCPLMSLPLAFGTTLQTVPAEMPYLHPEPDRLAAWRDRIDGGGFNIGLCWQGSAQSVAMDRSFALAGLRAIAGIPRVRLFSLQTGDGVEQLARLPPDMSVESLDPPGPELRPFVDSAAIIAGLDLVITADTAIAHLSGALGRPTWIMLKQVPDWRWGLTGPSTPWYPTARLFRQRSSGDWDGVCADVVAAVEQAVRLSAAP